MPLMRNEISFFRVRYKYIPECVYFQRIRVCVAAAIECIVEGQQVFLLLEYHSEEPVLVLPVCNGIILIVMKFSVQ